MIPAYSVFGLEVFGNMAMMKEGIFGTLFMRCRSNITQRDVIMWGIIRKEVFWIFNQRNISPSNS